MCCPCDAPPFLVHAQLLELGVAGLFDGVAGHGLSNANNVAGHTASRFHSTFMYLRAVPHTGSGRCIAYPSLYIFGY